MRRKIDYEMVKKEFDEQGYILLSKEYHNNTEKLQYLCPLHLDKGTQEITFASFTSGRGCGYCSKRKRKTQEDYVAELSVKKPNIEVVGKYVSLKTKILHRCKICEYEWETLPDNLLHLKNGCPKCGKRAKLTQEDFMEKLHDIHGDDIVPLEEYKAHSIKIKFQCNKCGHIWEAKPNNILNGKGCPKCKLSKGEKEIAKILDEHSVFYLTQHIFQDCVYIHYLPFDFYLPQLNLCIEYDGLQHYEPCTFGGIALSEAEKALALCQLKDKIKTDYCQTHGIKLLRIPYTQYNEIENIITSIIC